MDFPLSRHIAPYMIKISEQQKAKKLKDDERKMKEAEEKKIKEEQKKRKK